MSLCVRRHVSTLLGSETFVSSQGECSGQLLSAKKESTAVELRTIAQSSFPSRKPGKCISWFWSRKWGMGRSDPWPTRYLGANHLTD